MSIMVTHSGWPNADGGGNQEVNFNYLCKFCKEIKAAIHALLGNSVPKFISEIQGS